MTVSLGVGMVMMRIAMVMFMTMVPQLCFVEQKEKQQAHQQRNKQVVWLDACIKGFRQKMQKGSGQQCTCSQTEHVLRVATQYTKAEPGGKPDTANACSQGPQQNRQKSHPNS